VRPSGVGFKSQFLNRWRWSKQPWKLCGHDGDPSVVEDATSNWPRPTQLGGIPILLARVARAFLVAGVEHLVVELPGVTDPKIRAVVADQRAHQDLRVEATVDPPNANDLPTTTPQGRQEPPTEVLKTLTPSNY
jgi:hypothetical protein